VRSGITALGSGITDRGIRISSFFRDQGSVCTIFVGSGTKIGHAFGIKDQKFAYKNWDQHEKTYLVTTLKYSYKTISFMLTNASFNHRLTILCLCCGPVLAVY